jgi:hypothetical protein
MYAGFDGCVLYVVFQFTVADVVGRAWFPGIEACLEEARANVVLETDVAGSIEKVLVM